MPRVAVVPRFLCCWLAILLASCAPLRLYPEGYAACYERMQRHATQLAPGFEMLGYRLAIHLRLDDEMPGGLGFRQASNVMGDAIPSGRIRLRPAWVCDNDVVARAVVAHEMAHVALGHTSVRGSGLILEWEGLSKQEAEADELALSVLRQTGGHPQSERFIAGRLQRYGGGVMGTGGNPVFRGPPLKVSPTAP